jgi:hypothetical protein
MNEVPGEAVIVVDDKDHGPPNAAITRCCK